MLQCFIDWGTQSTKGRHDMTKHTNDLTNIPAAACFVCGGWTGHGGMSQHRDTTTPVLDRVGCTGPHMDTRAFSAEKTRQHAATRARIADVVDHFGGMSARNVTEDAVRAAMATMKRSSLDLFI